MMDALYPCTWYWKWCKWYWKWRENGVNMEITAKIVITYNETKENNTLQCVSFIFEGYNGRYGICFVIGENGHESFIAEMDEYGLKSRLQWHFFLNCIILLF